MTWQYTSFVVPIVVGCFLSVLLAAYTLRYVRGDRWTPVATTFLAVTTGLALWTGLAALKLLATDPWVKLALYRLLYLGVAPLGALALLFALAYTDRDQWITTPVVAGLLCVPALYVCLVFLNPGALAIESTRVVETNGIVVMRVEVGPAHWILESLYNATLSLVALGVIGYEAVRLGRSYLPQAALIAAGISAPFVFVVLSAVGVQPFDPDGVNLVPASSAVTASALGVAVFRYRLLELPPLAYTTAIEQSPDGVLVVDAAERVVHANDRGDELLSRHDAAVGDRLDEAFPEVDLSTADGDTVRVDATPDTVRLDAATGPRRFSAREPGT